MSLAARELVDLRSWDALNRNPSLAREVDDLADAPGPVGDQHSIHLSPGA